jgi:folate-binding protein YgfZ
MIWAALLPPQGKFLHDLFIVQQGDALLIDAEAARLDDLIKRLRLYKLRSQVTLTDLRQEMAVVAVWPAEGAAGSALPWNGGVLAVDPRLAQAGGRGYLPRAALPASTATLDEWDALRLPLGLPDGSRDMEIDKAILLENGFDELQGVDWKKGCYVGQELTARTKYRGLIKKRLTPVRFDGAAPAPGALLVQNDTEVGEMRSGIDGVGVALLRLEALRNDQPITAGSTTLSPRVPDWVAVAEG